MPCLTTTYRYVCKRKGSIFRRTKFRDSKTEMPPYVILYLFRTKSIFAINTNLSKTAKLIRLTDHIKKIDLTILREYACLIFLIAKINNFYFSTICDEKNHQWYLCMCQIISLKSIVKLLTSH